LRCSNKFIRNMIAYPVTDLSNNNIPFHENVFRNMSMKLETSEALANKTLALNITFFPF
jgi:hypothetical protein